MLVGRVGVLGPPVVLLVVVRVDVARGGGLDGPGPSLRVRALGGRAHVGGGRGRTAPHEPTPTPAGQLTDGAVRTALPPLRPPGKSSSRRPSRSTATGPAPRPEIMSAGEMTRTGTSWLAVPGPRLGTLEPSVEYQKLVWAFLRAGAVPGATSRWPCPRAHWNRHRADRCAGGEGDALAVDVDRGHVERLGRNDGVVEASDVVIFAAAGAPFHFSIVPPIHIRGDAPVRARLCPPLPLHHLPLRMAKRGGGTTDLRV